MEQTSEPARCAAYFFGSFFSSSRAWAFSSLNWRRSREALTILPRPQTSSQKSGDFDGGLLELTVTGKGAEEFLDIEVHLAKKLEEITFSLCRA